MTPDKTGMQELLSVKSNKQRRREIKDRRLKRAEKKRRSTVPSRWDLMYGGQSLSAGSLAGCYVDKPFICRDCGSAEVWTAGQQQWWYEVIKADPASTAIRCRACRQREKARKAEARRIHLEGLQRKLDTANRKGEHYGH